MNEDFVKELFKLCKKHKYNMEATVEIFGKDLSSDKFEVAVHGAWNISNKEKAVEVFKIQDSVEVMSLAGDISEEAFHEMVQESERLGLYD